MKKTILATVSFIISAISFAQTKTIDDYFTKLPFEMKKPVVPTFKNNIYNIEKFGGVADGKTLNTTAFANAITECNKNGGGTVIVPPGTYSTGTIELLSNVNLHLEAGAKLIGSKDTSDYKPMPNILFDEGYNRYGLIYAVEAKNISIT